MFNSKRVGYEVVRGNEGSGMYWSFANRGWLLVGRRNRRWVATGVATGVALASLWVVGVASARADDTFTKVPVQVNVLKGATASDDDIAEIIKEANAVLKQAKIALEFDKSKNIARDFNDQGNNDSKVDSGEDAKLDKFSVEELEKKFGKGKGYKLVITEEIHGTASTFGLSPHDPESPVTYLTLKSKGNKARGNDLAHEFSHVFTLGVNHKLDGTTNADGTAHHPTDKNNLMYPFNNGDTTVRGGELTPDQIKEIQDKAKKRGTSKLKTETSVLPLNTLHGSFTDDLNDTGTAHVDLLGGSLFIDHGSDVLDISLGLNGMFPQGQFRTDYSIFFDTDDNPLTGDTFGVFEGVDKSVRIITTRSGMPGAPIQAQSILTTDAAGGGGTQLIDEAVPQVVEQINDSGHEGVNPLVQPYHDRINQHILLSDLGFTTDMVRVGVDGFSFNTFEFDVVDFFRFDLQTGDGPRLDLLKLTGSPGDDVIVIGSGFLANGMVDLFIDDDTLASGFATDNFGSFSGSFTVPFVDFNGDGVVDAADYLITARDRFSPPLTSIISSQATPGFGFDFSVFTIVPEPGTAVATGLGFLGLLYRRRGAV